MVEWWIDLSISWLNPVDNKTIECLIWNEPSKFSHELCLIELSMHIFMIPNNRIESLIGIERRKKKDRDIIKCNKMGESSGMRGGVRERSGVERRGGGYTSPDTKML